MFQKSLLLEYKKSCQQLLETKSESNNYDVHMGLWKNQSNDPLIEKFINREINEVYGATIETRTREGIDRSEVSNESNIVFQSILTFTRESVDRSETS